MLNEGLARISTIEKPFPVTFCPVAKCGGMTRSGWKVLVLAMRERALRTQPSATISYRIDSEQ